MKCGECLGYWSLEGQSLLPHWNEPNRAGTCCVVAGQPFRLFDDEPIMGCWIDPKTGTGGKSPCTPVKPRNPQ